VEQEVQLHLEQVALILYYQGQVLQLLLPQVEVVVVVLTQGMLQTILVELVVLEVVVEQILLQQ
jgi:hypothetical protein